MHPVEQLNLLEIRKKNSTTAIHEVTNKSKNHPVFRGATSWICILYISWNISTHIIECMHSHEHNYEQKQTNLSHEVWLQFNDCTCRWGHHKKHWEKTINIVMKHITLVITPAKICVWPFSNISRYIQKYDPESGQNYIDLQVSNVDKPVRLAILATPIPED